MTNIYLLSWISTELLYHEIQKNESLFEKKKPNTQLLDGTKEIQ